MNRSLRRNGSSAPQGSPYTGKHVPVGGEVAPVRPTPQRERQAEFGVSEVVTEVTVYRPGGGDTKETATARRVKTPEQAYCDQITDEMYDAAVWFRKLGYAVQCQKVTASYDGVVSHSRGPRTGGPGNSDEMWKDAIAYGNVIAKLADLAWIAERTLVLEDLPFAELGAMRSMFRDKATLRGVGFGVWHTMLVRLAQIYRLERALTKAPPPQSDIMRSTQRLMPKMPEVKRHAEQLRRRG